MKGDEQPLRRHRRAHSVAAEEPALGQRCELCGRRSLEWRRTECCGRIVCRGGSRSCHRHERYTLCGVHHFEGHSGGWKTCEACRSYFHDLEVYVYYGTNAYNFEKLENPPTYEPTHCAGCGRVIVLSRDEYEVGPDGYRCEACFED